MTEMTCLHCPATWTTEPKPGSSSRCPGCGKTRKVTSTAPTPRTTTTELVQTTGKSSSWVPAPVASQPLPASPGTCTNCDTTRTFPRNARGTMATCRTCGTWVLPADVIRAHSRAAGDQQHSTTGQRDASHRDLYSRIRTMRSQTRDLLADVDIPEDAKGELEWLLDELEDVRKIRNLGRLGELEDYAATIDLGTVAIAYDEDHDQAGDDTGDLDDPAAAARVIDGAAYGVLRPPARPRQTAAIERYGRARRGEPVQPEPALRPESISVPQPCPLPVTSC
jgi:hypothetical protein